MYVPIFFLLHYYTGCKTLRLFRKENPVSKVSLIVVGGFLQMSYSPLLERSQLKRLVWIAHGYLW